MGEILDAFIKAFDTDNTKRCSKCLRYLPVSEFKRDARTRDSLSYRCLNCLNLQKRKGYSQLVRQPSTPTIVPNASSQPGH